MSVLVLIASDVLVFASGAFGAIAFLLWTDRGDAYLRRLRGDRVIRLEVEDDVVYIRDEVLSLNDAEAIREALQREWEAMS